MDDIQGLGENTPDFRDLLLSYQNWKSSPTYDFESHRQVIEFDNSSASIFSLEDKQPVKLEFDVTVDTKKEEYLLTKFFNDRKGDLERFWFPLTFNIFTLTNAVNIGQEQFEVNSPNFTYLGHERIFLLLQNGDLITRHVTDFDLISGTPRFTVAEFDRRIEPEEVILSSMMLLMRFDQPQLDLDFPADMITSNTRVRLIECVQEYDSEDL